MTISSSIMRSVLVACLAGAGSACALADGPRFTLIDDALKQSLVGEVSGPTQGPRGEVMFSDARGVPRELPVAKAVALAPSWWSDPVTRVRGDFAGYANAGLLVTTDGQRLPGRPSAVPATGEEVAWEHPRFGRVVVSLERVSEIEIPEPPPPPAPVQPAMNDFGAPPAREPVKVVPERRKSPPPTDRSRDTVELANGDRLAGLVEKIGAEVLVSGTGGKPTSVELSRVRRIWLANPSAAPAGAMVWLADGTVVGSKRFVIEPAQPLALGDWATERRSEAPEAPDGAPAPRPTPYMVEDVTAAALQPKRLRPFADLPVREQRGAGDRRLVRGVQVSDDALRVGGLPAPLGARDIELPAPMVADFTLPAGAQRVSGSFEMPESSWTWGDCRVRLEAVAAGGAGATTLVDTRLNAETPTAAFAMPVPPGATALRISVEPGERGAVQDRVLLRRGLLLLAP